jgi:hypothetical protein
MQYAIHLRIFMVIDYGYFFQVWSTPFSPAVWMRVLCVVMLLHYSHNILGGGHFYFRHFGIQTQCPSYYITVQFKV